MISYEERREAFRRENPELFPYDPEPCDDCDTGVLYLVCFDEVRRCKNCVTRLADQNGWNDPPPPRESDNSPLPDPPPTPPDLRAFAAERRERDDNVDAGYVQQALV